MTDDEISDAFFVLPIKEGFGADVWPDGARPLLAHYTSLHSLEKILQSDEVWFSNPLFMNDLEEMRFGLNVARDEFLTNTEVRKAAGTEQRASIIEQRFIDYFTSFDSDQALDVYVFCLSEHDPADFDGKLSMWRAYARNGNGAALVFDTRKIDNVENSPLIVARVKYGTQNERTEWIKNQISNWAKRLAEASLDDSQLYLPVFYLFELIKMNALTTKHSGFVEEHEWRLIYFPDRDEKKVLASQFGYVISERGVEPKLKLKVKPTPDIIGPNGDIVNLTERIILGPSVSSYLAKTSFLRMLDKVGKGVLGPKVVSSTIPLRPSS